MSSNDLGHFWVESHRPRKTQRHEHQLRRYLKQAEPPYEKRMEDFDFSIVPALPKTCVLEFAQGVYLVQHENVLLIGSRGLGRPTS